MDSNTAQKIEDLALDIERLRDMKNGEDKDWIIRLIQGGQAVLSALETLEAIENVPLTYEEIAHELNCHETTVKHRLQALSRGGIRINMSGKTAMARTGRPRKLLEKI